MFHHVEELGAVVIVALEEEGIQALIPQDYQEFQQWIHYFEQWLFHLN